MTASTDRPMRAGARAAMMLLLFAAMFASGGGCGMKVRMPGRSFTGAMPAMDAVETDVSARLRGHVEHIAGTIGDRSWRSPDRLAQTVAYIEQQLGSAGYPVNRQEYPAEGQTFTNLQAELRGATKPEEVIVVGAHYDTIPGCPGANDNTSGVAAVIELARLLRDRPVARTVRFVAFANEEPPFFKTDQMGSRVYARGCKQRGERVVAMISVETIGSYSDAKGSQQYPFPLNLLYPGTGNFIAFVSDDASSDLLKRCVASFRRHTRFPSEGGAAPASIQGVDWSDHWSFWQEGYPAIMVTDTAPFRYTHYHQPTDTPDKLDYDRTARVVAGLGRVIEELANDDDATAAGKGR